MRPVVVLPQVRAPALPGVQGERPQGRQHRRDAGGRWPRHRPQRAERLGRRTARGERPDLPLLEGVGVRAAPVLRRRRDRRSPSGRRRRAVIRLLTLSRRSWSIVAPLVVVATLAGCSSSGSPGASGTPSTSASATSSSPGASTSSPSVAGARALRRFYGQRLQWHSCGDGFSCASLLVPVDYAHPAGATMHVAVVRKPASGSRKGALIINPGGPGASGIDYARGSTDTFESVTTHFDLVSFDPRGVGQSKPVRCVTSGQLDALIHGDPTPDNAQEHADLIASSKRFADACFARNHGYLEHVGTIDAARDMDVLRDALGDAKLTYYGASYGTYLGAKYAQLFPKRIRAMVLDGALDPIQPTIAENRVQAVGFETDLRDFLASCARSGSCPFGSSPSAAEQGLDDLAA